MDQKKDLHIEKCCIICGCKWRNDETCSVVLGIVKQLYPCGQTSSCTIEIDEEEYIPATIEEDYSD